jgi:hypothetical protein
MLILGESHLRAVLIECQVHYSAARPHQGVAQSVPDELHAPSATVTGLDTGRIRRRSVLNGLINEYMRACARRSGRSGEARSPGRPPRPVPGAGRWWRCRTVDAEVLRRLMTAGGRACFRSFWPVTRLAAG